MGIICPYCAKGARAVRRGTKLYNLILPLWLLWIFPQTWLVVLPANFIVDLLVSALALRFAGARGIAGVLKFSILHAHYVLLPEEDVMIP